MSRPPGLIVTNAAREIERFDLPTIDVPHIELQIPRPDKGKRTMTMTSPAGPTRTRASEDLPRPMLNRGKRVMSTPAGGLMRQPVQMGISRFSARTPAGNPLRLPPKLAGTRWSDVPATWMAGAVDPLRCHSVDHLPRPEWQNGPI